LLRSVSETNCGVAGSLKRKLQQKIVKSFYSRHCFAARELGRLRVEISREDRPVQTADTTEALLHDLLDDRSVGVQIDHRCLQTLRPPIYFCEDFFKKSAQKLTKKHLLELHIVCYILRVFERKN
jgi:hypothetical protein